MDIQSEKYSLIEFITKINEPELIYKLKEFVEANEEDFWLDLSEDQKADIKKGIEELDRGEGTSYDAFISKYK